MKYILNFLAVTLLSFQLVMGQNIAVPTSDVVDVSQLLKDLKTLSADDMQGRKFGTPGGAKAREYIEGRFKKAGLQPFGDSYLQPFEITGRNGGQVSGANIIGFLKGAKNTDRYIIITAHYDHLGVEGGEVFNGADDNASGTAALFAMAEYFRQKKPNNSLIFVAFDAEELGLLGAKKFVENLPVKKEQVLLNINMDMIAHNDVNELYASGTKHYPNLKPYLETIAKSKATQVKLLLGHDQPNPPGEDWTNQSDQYPFHQAKIPFIYFGVEDHKDYHKATDEFENINQPFYVHAVETILAAVKLFDEKLLKS
jgi:Zn-dependent M28 family amino/carboxypeptidase